MQSEQEGRVGLLAALVAFLIWGLAPLYYRLLERIPASEILAHRTIWTLVLALFLLVLLRQLTSVSAILCRPRVALVLLITALLIGSNWLVFIWAITHQHVSDASLGYYINPLVNVVFGLFFLGERLRPLQWLAVLLAAAGVAFEIWQFGRLPWVALFLAFSFGFYALLRKRVPVDSLAGLAVETLFLFPASVLYLIASDSPTSNMLTNTTAVNGILLFTGPITLVPLLLFTIAARRLRLSTLGFLQYIGPTLMLLLALGVFNEPFPQARLVSFVLVWVGLLFFSADALLQRRRLRRVLSGSG